MSVLFFFFSLVFELFCGGLFCFCTVLRQRDEYERGEGKSERDGDRRGQRSERRGADGSRSWFCGSELSCAGQSEQCFSSHGIFGHRRLSVDKSSSSGYHERQRTLDQTPRSGGQRPIGYFLISQ